MNAIYKNLPDNTNLNPEFNILSPFSRNKWANDLILFPSMIINIELPK